MAKPDGFVNYRPDIIRDMDGIRSAGHRTLRIRLVAKRSSLNSIVGLRAGKDSMKVTIDEDGWGFETETAHYTHDGHYGKTEKELKADVLEIVRILSESNKEDQTK